jgi:hypothetical protein
VKHRPNFSIVYNVNSDDKGIESAVGRQDRISSDKLQG